MVVKFKRWEEEKPGATKRHTYFAKIKTTKTIKPTIIKTHTKTALEKLKAFSIPSSFFIERKIVTEKNSAIVPGSGVDTNRFRPMKKTKYMDSDFIDYIQFEYGGANLDSHTSLMEIYKFLNDRNFEIAKIMRDGLEIRKYQPYMDNFNYSNYVAISRNLTK